jgi:hypothetical protein
LALSITGAIMAGGLLAPAQAQQVFGTPRYKIEAVSFKAVDESGWDGSWWAPVSDEPFFIWSGTNANSGTVTTRRSPVFGDVDTGESRNFSPAVCVVRTCVDGVTGPIGLNTVVMENDFGDPATVQSYVQSAVSAAHWAARIFGYELPSTYDSQIISFLTSWFGDDLIAERSVAWSPAELAWAMPTVGSVFYETIDYASGDGHYRITYKLTRTTDLPPVIG